MRFFSFFASAALAGLALAQGNANIAFTSVPASVTAGDSYTISWGGGDGTSPVTLTLRKGDVDDIQTVQVLTTDATGTSYKWTPSSSLVDGADYSLQITQGLNSINYSGQFTVSGGVDPVSASISSILASASSAIASANATISALAPITSLAEATSSMGTGTALPRNTTFSSATLGASSTATTGTSTAARSATSPTSTGTNGAEAVTSRYASPMALFCAILTAIACAI